MNPKLSQEPDQNGWDDHERGGGKATCYEGKQVIQLGDYGKVTIVKLQPPLCISATGKPTV